jgi:hypothetical protein
MKKDELYIKLDEVMFNEKKRMTYGEVVEFLLEKYWATIKTDCNFSEPEPDRFDRLIQPDNLFVLFKMDSIKESWKGTGTYIRHYFKNTVTGIEYILDVTPSTNKCFGGLKTGKSALLKPTVFFRNDKWYINGKKAATIIDYIKPTAAQAIEMYVKKPKKNILDL